MKLLPADDPFYLHHYKLPSDAAVLSEDRRRRVQAERASRMLAEAMQRVLGQ